MIDSALPLRFYIIIVRSAIELANMSDGGME